MDSLDEFLGTAFFGITMQQMLFAAVAVTAGFFGGRILERVLDGIAKRTPPGSMREAIVAALGRPAAWAVRVAGIWMALKGMPLETVDAMDVDMLVDRLAQGVTVALATWLGVRIVGRVADVLSDRAQATEGTFDDQLVPIFRKAAIAFLVVAGVVMIIQNLGYSAASLLAGFGLGGAALAFASKDTVANFFGSIVIFVDRPFQIGDWVEVGDVEGTVETVGIRVTRIRTFANALLTIPNATFTTSPINNWSRMRKRRIKMTIGLTYDTTPDKMRQAVEAVRDIIRNDDRLHQDFFLVNFFDFGASSLDIFCYLFTRTTNWAEHMQIREEFMLRVMEAMQGLGLEFAFPTTTVHLAGGGDRAKKEPQGAPKAMQRDTPL
ncbi:MAG: mechanosensitive ion channel family protein [Nannocystaceae bacterium]|nr:mechanosensitive ion channel family protein [bacterium]